MLGGVLEVLHRAVIAAANRSGARELISQYGVGSASSAMLTSTARFR
jgi:hypothetical protein